MSVFNYILQGGKIQVGTLKGMLKNSYNDKLEQNIDGYKLDKELSGSRVQVYTHPKTKHVVVAHRGTKGFQDVMTDMKSMLGFKNSKRYNHSRDITTKAINKYGDGYTHTVIGHSLGSDLAREANKEHKKELVGLNGLFTKAFEAPKKNEFHIYSSLDPASVLHQMNPMKTGNDIKIKATNFNLLDQHKTDMLDELDQSQYIGNEE